AALGALMLLVGALASLRQTWRKRALAVLAAGLIGAALTCLGLRIVTWVFSGGQPPPGVWLLFGAAGFGWASLMSAGLIAFLPWFRVPNRWIDRRKAATGQGAASTEARRRPS